MFFVPIPRAIAIERGLKSYFSNKPCKRGLISSRLVSNKSCTCHLCLTARKPAALRAKRKYSKNNQEKISIAQKKYLKDNPDAVKSSKQKYRNNNTDKISNQNKIYYKENKVRIDLRNNTYKRNNPERGSLHAQRRRARIYHATPSWDFELTDFVLLEALSLAALRKDIFNFAWHVDHMIPIKAKTVCGLHVWNNFQCIPQTINQSKQNSLIYTNPHEWLYDISKFFKVVYQQEITA